MREERQQQQQQQRQLSLPCRSCRFRSKRNRRPANSGQIKQLLFEDSLLIDRPCFWTDQSANFHDTDVAHWDPDLEVWVKVRDVDDRDVNWLVKDQRVGIPCHGGITPKKLSHGHLNLLVCQIHLKYT